MPIHKEECKLNYSPEQLFKLVAEVERYPEFLAPWKDVEVSQKYQNRHGQTIYSTKQRIQLGPIYKQFYTQTTLIPFQSIHIVSTDPTFQKFAINWFFNTDVNNGCRIQFAIDCIASSILLRPVFDIALSEASKTIIRSFENRALLIYGS
ncbi:MAG: hypothetical protein HQL46_09100 [Gammaproteobacteria bacterium]|nr:hypothetical protein [Gammaproteobacteria bacterium]